MNIRELIDDLLSFNTEPSIEVQIALVGGKSISTFRVAKSKSSGRTVLTIEPDEDLMTTEDAHEKFGKTDA